MGTAVTMVKGLGRVQGTRGTKGHGQAGGKREGGGNMQQEWHGERRKVNCPEGTQAPWDNLDHRDQ